MVGAGTFDPRRPRQIASWGVFIALAGGIFAWIGVMAIGATAWTQISIFAEPVRSVEALRNGSQPALTATKQGDDLYLVR